MAKQGTTWEDVYGLFNKPDRRAASYPFEPNVKACPLCGGPVPTDFTTDLCHECDDLAADNLVTAAVERIDLAWVEKLRKDFLNLLKNLPKVKDYQAAHVLRNAFRIYRNNFDELVFKRFLNKALRYDFEFDEGTVKWLDKKLRGPAWTFSAELAVPIGFADKYVSEGQHFVRFEQEYPKWKNRVQAKARAFWTELRDALRWMEAQNKPGFDVQVLDREQTVLEGFRLTMIGYDPSDRINVESLAKLKEGLKLYRRNASKMFPWLLKNQLPVELLFEASLDQAGSYSPQKITIHTSSMVGKSPKWLCHVMAHEMGHHLYRSLSGGAKEFWNTAIRGDYGDLDVQELLDKWPGDIWAFQFPEKFGLTDPLLSLQVDAISHDPSYSMGRESLQRKEDFQALLDRGTKTLRVPKTPITGYANKNPEEAMCEAIGLLVTHGPRAVHKKIRGWLNIVVPGEVKLATDAETAFGVAARFMLTARHSRSKCMSCSAKPTVAYLWAEGMARAWFCDKHGKEWSKEHDDINETYKVEDGIVPEKFQ